METQKSYRENSIYIRELYVKCTQKNIEIRECIRENDYVVVNEKHSQAFLLRMVYPDQKSLAIYGRLPSPSHNCEVSAHYSFTADDPIYPPDYMGFAWRNQVKLTTDFLFIKTEELKVRLELISGESGVAPTSKVLLWIFPDDFVFVASDLSGEGEWFLLGSGLARNGDRDFSKYLNRWEFL